MITSIFSGGYKKKKTLSKNKADYVLLIFYSALNHQNKVNQDKMHKPGSGLVNKQRNGEHDPY